MAGAPVQERASAGERLADEGVPLAPRLGGRILAWVTASKLRLGGMATVLILGLSAVLFLAGQEPPPTPAERLLQALELLDDRENRVSRDQARKIAKEILEEPERGEEFLGGPEFVLGIVQFRDAEEAGEATRESKHLAAIKLLREAESLGMVPEREDEWLHAMAISLHRVGSVSIARPLLEQAVRECEEDRDEVMGLLVDTYLDLKTPKELNQALAITEELGKLPLAPEKRDRALMQRAQVLMALNRPADAEATLKQVSLESWNLGTRVFSAQTLMARQQYAEAMKHLERVAGESGLDRTFTRQASYLMGVCAEKQGDIETAISQFERTVTRFERTHESLASQLRAADLLRRVHRNEEALAGYRSALRTVRNVADFRNRWMTIDDFRSTVLDAWDGWIGTKNFAEAIELARSMTPLLSDRQAKEHEARARQAWAETIDAESRAARWSDRQALREALFRRWRESAAAYAELAELQKTVDEYPDTLWISAEHFARGHDYGNAASQLNAFLETRPKRLVPLALVRRGRALRDLDRHEEALALFGQVIRQHPTDPAVFEARYLAGACSLELGRSDNAEAIWRGLLTSSELTPDAQQWRQSLFDLGRLLYHSACRMAGKAQASAASDSTLDPASKAPEEAYRRWDEAAQRFDEFVRRYPTDPNVDEARFLLAESLQYGAGQHREKLRTAETENSRQELRRQLQSQLEQAIDHLQTLRTGLLEKSESGDIDPLRRRMLRNTYFEIAGAWYALEQYDKAVIAYSGAANRYPQDPHVLLAYLQMAQCYERLGKAVEARSMLQQARVIFSGMPQSTFDSRDSGLSRDEWNQWLAWAARLRDQTPP